jgi:hypothetical protein
MHIGCIISNGFFHLWNFIQLVSHSAGGAEERSFGIDEISRGGRDATTRAEENNIFDIPAAVRTLKCPFFTTPFDHSTFSFLS